MSRTVFVENVDPQTTVEALREMLPESAGAGAVEICPDPKAEDGALVAFISVGNGRAVPEAVQALDGQTCAGRVLRAKVLKQRGGRGGLEGGVGPGVGPGRSAGGKRSIFSSRGSGSVGGGRGG